MININDFLNENSTIIKNIILEFNVNKEFSSHDFIQKFITKFESDYIEMLLQYQNSGRAFQNVNSQIAKFLSLNENELSIIKTELNKSENVRGNYDEIQWWIRF